MTSPFEIFRSPLTVYRQSGGVYSNMTGEWVKGTETPISITASIQPTTGEEMLSLPEGRRNKKTYSLFTSTPVQLIVGGQNPDQVTIFGERYELIKVDVWQNKLPLWGIVNHYKFYASKLEAIANAP